MGLLLASVLVFALWTAVEPTLAAVGTLVVLWAVVSFSKPAPRRPRQGKRWAWGIAIPPFIFMRRGDDQTG